MGQTDNYQEHQMPNGVYVMEKRIGHWIVWAPNDVHPLYVDRSYEMAKLLMNVHSEQKVKNE